MCFYQKIPIKCIFFKCEYSEANKINQIKFNLPAWNKPIKRCTFRRFICIKQIPGDWTTKLQYTFLVIGTVHFYNLFYFKQFFSFCFCFFFLCIVVTQPVFFSKFGFLKCAEQSMLPVDSKSVNEMKEKKMRQNYFFKYFVCFKKNLSIFR